MMGPTAKSHKEFVAEAIAPAEGSFATTGMASGGPGLPRRFRWRDADYEVAQVLAVWKTTGPCRHGSGERYVRRHWFRIVTGDGAEMEIYFDRQARAGRKSHRWWLATIVRPPET